MRGPRGLGRHAILLPPSRNSGPRTRTNARGRAARRSGQEACRGRRRHRHDARVGYEFGCGFHWRRRQLCGWSHGGRLRSPGAGRGARTSRQCQPERRCEPTRHDDHRAHEPIRGDPRPSLALQLSAQEIEILIGVSQITPQLVDANSGMAPLACRVLVHGDDGLPNAGQVRPEIVACFASCARRRDKNRDTVNARSDTGRGRRAAQVQLVPSAGIAKAHARVRVSDRPSRRPRPGFASSFAAMRGPPADQGPHGREAGEGVPAATMREAPASTSQVWSQARVRGGRRPRRPPAGPAGFRCGRDGNRPSPPTSCPGSFMPEGASLAPTPHAPANVTPAD